MITTEGHPLESNIGSKVSLAIWKHTLKSSSDTQLLIDSLYLQNNFCKELLEKRWPIELWINEPLLYLMHAQKCKEILEKGDILTAISLEK